MDIVILTPIALEYEITSKLIESIKLHNQDNFIYETGFFQGDFHRYSVAIRETGPKIEDIALATEKAIQHHRPAIVFLVGIAGGVKDVSIGDIVVGTKAYGYESGKETDDRFLVRPDSIVFDPDLVEFAKYVARRSQWRKSITTETPPKVYFGPIASGNKLVATNKQFVSQLLRHNFNDTIALEMEAIGFAKALVRYPFVRAMNLRGVSDLLEKKSETDQAGSQSLAMVHLAAFFTEFLRLLDFPKYSNKNMQAANLKDSQLNQPTLPAHLTQEDKKALKQILEQINELLSQNRIDKALEQFQSGASKYALTALAQELIYTKQMWENWKKNSMMGVMTAEFEDISRNKIVLSIIKMVKNYLHLL